MAIDNHGFTPDKNIYNLTSILSRLDALEQAGRALDFNKVYPVGSIYITTDNRNPTSYFTGTVWERYGQGRVIVGVNESDTDFNSAGKTGGSKTRKHGLAGSTDGTAINISQMPGHYHNLGTHTHAFQYSGAKGSPTDYNIYTNIIEPPEGVHKVNVWIPRPGTGALEDGALQVRKVNNDSEATNKLSVGTPEGETVTNVTGGNGQGPYYPANAHSHTLKGGTVDINTVQPYIACYIWRRKS